MSEHDWEHPQEPPSDTETDAEPPPSLSDEPEPEPVEEPTDEPVEGTDEPEPATEPEPAPQSRDPKEIDRIYAKMDKLRETHENRVRAILGDDFQHAVMCPLCSHFSPGFVGVVDVPEDAIPVLRAICGMPDISSFSPDPGTEPCATCQGKGQTLTGSLVPNNETRTCPTCMGRGYTLTGGILPPPGNGDEPAPVLTGPTAPPVEPNDPAVAALQARGFTVIPPIPAMTP